MSPVTACLLALLTVGFLVTEHDASVLQEVEADILEFLALEELAERAETVGEKITGLIQGEQDCINADDLDCLMEFFDDDVRTMRTGHSTDIGIAETRAHFHWVKDFQATLTVDEVLPTDPDASYVVSRLEIAAQFRNGTVFFVGKAVQVWKKINSDYKVYIDIFNQN